MKKDWKQYLPNWVAKRKFPAASLRQGAESIKQGAASIKQVPELAKDKVRATAVKRVSKDLADSGKSEYDLSEAELEGLVSDEETRIKEKIKNRLIA
ncbi:MAG: hypothetical protein ACR2PJ_04160, partial [Pseudomonadales bacterium]